MRLVEAAVDRYGLLEGWNPQLTDGLTVLSGPNEAGKSLYLEALLQLMDDAVVDILNPPPRIDAQPVGRVVIEYAGERYELGIDGVLSDVTPIQPADLPTVLVVRDNDLILPEGPGYYADLVEHLGEIHSSAIDAIVDELKAAGRLTDKRLRLSDQHEDAKSTHADAEALRDDIDAFLDEVGSDGLDILQQERIQVERDRRRARSDLETQRDARIAFEYDQLAKPLETYEDAAAKIDELEPFTRKQLAALRTLKQEVEATMGSIRGHEADIDRYSEAIEQVERDQSLEHETVERPERREDSVEEEAGLIERYRERSQDAIGAGRRERLGGRATVAGGIATGLAAAAGAITGSTGVMVFAVVLLAFTILAVGTTYRAMWALSAVERTESRVLELARDAGFEARDIESIATAIEEYRADVAMSRKRLAKLEGTIAARKRDLDDARESFERRSARLQHLQDTLDEELSSAGVEDLSEFDERVARREDTVKRRDLADQRLSDGLGATDESAWQDRANAYRHQLSAMVADLDLSKVDVDTFDEDHLSELERQVAALEKRRVRLDEKLTEYDDRVADFDARAPSLRSRPYLGRQLTIEAAVRRRCDPSSRS